MPLGFRSRLRRLATYPALTVTLTTGASVVAAMPAAAATTCTAASGTAAAP